MALEDELYLAKISVNDLLSDKNTALTKDKLIQASKSLNKSELKIQKVLNADEVKPKKLNFSIKIKDFDSITEILRKPQGLNLVEKLNGIKNDVAKESLIITIPQIVSQLAEMIPVNSSQTLTGIDVRPPSDREKFKFIQKVRVLDDPFIVFDLMEVGLLNQTEIEALKLFYPELYQVWSQQILEQVISLKKEPTRRQNQQLSVFLELPRLNPETMKRLQMQYEEEQQKEGPKGDALAQNLSETQKVEAR